MPKTRLTKETFKTHWQYGKWIYVAIAACAYFVGSMAFTMTEYRPPAERQVEFQLVGIMADAQPVQLIAESLLEDAQAFDPTLELISAYNIMYSGDPETDMYGVQKFVTLMAARQGTVYMVGPAQLDQIVQGAGALPLDDYIESGAISVEGLDLEPCTFDEPPENEEDPPTGVRHVYAIPCNDLARFEAPDIALDVSDKYLVIMSFCPNPDTAVDVTERLRNAMRSPE